MIAQSALYKSPSLFETHSPLVGNLPHSMTSSYALSFCDGCTHWISSAESQHVWRRFCPIAPPLWWTGTLFQGNTFQKLWKPYNEQTPRVKTQREQRLPEKGQGVYQPCLIKKTQEKTSGVVGKPPPHGQKSTSISSWKAKPRIKT